MATALAKTHIRAQQRLREIVARAVTTIWQGLPGYDRANVDEWLSRVVPIALAGQRQSALLVEAFIAQSLNGQPVGVNIDDIIGDALRNGTPAATVYERPFITVWSALGAGTAFDDAVAQGLARATSTAATDVQLAMRSTLTAVGQEHDEIVGYQRVPDAGACTFCTLVAGQRYTTDQLMPIHNHCGCGVDVITLANRGDFTGNPENDLSVSRDGVTAAVREHGELGPVLTDGSQAFTGPDDI